MTTVLPALRLIGRSAELEVLFGLVDRIPQGGGALLLSGEPGIGKTSLLEAASRHAAERGVQVLSGVGVPSEADLPFSGLHQLLLLGSDRSSAPPAPPTGDPQVSTSMFDRLEQLPEPQRDALRSAFGLDVEPAPDRFLVGLAVLSLLSEAAEEQPLLCVVDDAQWLDQTSAQALAFVARRLSAEPVAIVFAAGEQGENFRGLPELMVEGLADAEALELLHAAVPAPLDERVSERILAESRGNPLALLELPRGLSPAQLAGGFGFPAVTAEMRSLSGRLEESFLQRLETLPADTQLLLLVAAADPVGDPALLWRAAQRLGIEYDALSPAATSGLLEVDGRVRFRHPLVRSAVYRTALLADRRRVHQALAEVTEPDVDPDRRAWHRAQAIPGPDAEVAAELERSAGRAQARGGLAAAAAFLERSVGLTIDPRLRTQRALVAARAKYEAAAPDAASALLAIAEMGPLDEIQRARLERLRVQIAFARERGTDPPTLLLDAAKRLEPLNADLARETYLEALASAIFAGRKNRSSGVVQVAEAARDAPLGPEPPRPVDLLLDGLATRFTEPYAAAVAPLRRALRALAGHDRHTEEDMRWLWFSCSITPEPLAPELWDDEAWHELATRAVRHARDAGALAILPLALTYRAGVHVQEGDFDDASALIAEAEAITDATGNAPLKYSSLLLIAWRGREEALDVIDTGIEDATARGEGRAIGFAQYVKALLYNGLGRYPEALIAAQGACAHDDLGLFGLALTELVEAAVRCDRRTIALDAMRRLEERTHATGTEWALGIEARARALLSEDEVAEHLYREAIERLGRTRIRVELVRTQLQYGEWLRRRNRRVDARKELHGAYDAFASMGAEGFAERARRELLASGEKVRKRLDQTRDELTPQERQIALLAREGLSNSEIGSRLFISPRTVEWHLRKVFAKLGIRSRMSIREALPASGDPEGAGT
jgi:DNA-binding CsgD family transcriptional regulator/tetratricopeptide (TPR) repeat protein